MIWLLIVCVLGLMAFAALGIEDSHYLRALRAANQS